jgi:hypothetical protein
MQRIPSLTSGASALLLVISGLVLAGTLPIMAIVARPNMAPNAGSIPIEAMTTAAWQATAQDGTTSPSPRLRNEWNDLRWYLLATAATSRNRYPSPFATETVLDQASAHHRRKLGRREGSGHTVSMVGRDRSGWDRR